MKNKLIKFLPILVCVVFLIFISLAYENKVFSLHFVDEEDNLVLGKYLLEDKKLYSDLFSHHQPLAYILSAGVQKITDPNSIFLLIKRHREVIITFSFIWAVFLVSRFGTKALGFVVIYELTKIYLLGNLFLAESLVIYPLVYLTFLLFSEKKYGWEKFFSGFCLFFCLLMLAPIWPLLIFLGVLVIWKFNLSLKNISLFLLGGVPFVVLSLMFSSVYYYFFNVFYINFGFYIPLTSDDPLYISSLKALFTPAISFLPALENTPTLWITRFLSVIFIGSLTYLLIQKKYKVVITTIIILALANFRFVNPGLQYYQGFHILPFYALLITLVFILIFQYLNKPKNLKIISIILGCLVTIVAINFSAKDLFKKVDINQEFYINYSRQFDIGEAVRIMKNPGDTLFIAPDEWLVYWQADINPASKMINYYAWMAKTPPLENIVSDMFAKNPPTFLYTNMEGTGLDIYYPQYIEMERLGSKRRLFVNPQRFNSLTKEQKDQLSFFDYKLD